MARIRTIKPDMWTDRGVAECSRSARLLFVAALNFATDFGVLLDSPIELKMKCFPADNLASGEIEEWINDLVKHGLWLRRTAPNGDAVLIVRSFSEHQRINKITPGKWDDPSKWDSVSGTPVVVDDRYATTTRPLPELVSSGRVALTPGREGKGMEGKGMDNPRPSFSSDLQGAVDKSSKPDGGGWPAEVQEIEAAIQDLAPIDERHRKLINACLDVSCSETEIIDHVRCNWPDDVIKPAALLTHRLSELSIEHYGTPIAPAEPTPSRHPLDCPGGCKGDDWISLDDGVIRCDGETRTPATAAQEPRQALAVVPDA